MLGKCPKICVFMSNKGLRALDGPLKKLPLTPSKGELGML